MHKANAAGPLPFQFRLEDELGREPSLVTVWSPKRCSAGRRPRDEFLQQEPQNEREGTRKVKKKPVRLESHY